ncbi:MAG: Exodeoxyribonuclease III [Planctomycetes bacterium]|nr:Exodeoxyribonuclease III [Planctomycetota bacterium]
MKIATWNVNSIRVRADAVAAWLESARPDVLCLQEIKVVDGDFPAARYEGMGYRAAVSGQKTYNGVAILARDGMSDVVAGFADGAEEDPQRRLLRATIGGVRVIDAYCPNGEDVGTEKYAYKLAWFARLLRVLETQESPSKPLVLLGDFNIAPEAIDVHAPDRWEGKVLCSGPEREALAGLRAWGLEDCVRAKHPGEPKLFSWWDYRLAAFQRGWGLRIDHILATAPLAARLRAAEIDVEPRKAERPSDHAPVWAEFGP